GVWSHHDQSDARGQVAFSYSTDGGLIWSTAVNIEEKTDAWLPSVAVNSQGLVAVCWYATTVNGNAKNSHQSFCLRISDDNGKTWSSVTQLSEAPSRVDDF